MYRSNQAALYEGTLSLARQTSLASASQCSYNGIDISQGIEEYTNPETKIKGWSVSSAFFRLDEPGHQLPVWFYRLCVFGVSTAPLPLIFLSASTAIPTHDILRKTRKSFQTTRRFYSPFSCLVETRCNETTKSSSDRCFWSFFGDLPCIRLSNPALSWRR